MKKLLKAIFPLFLTFFSCTIFGQNGISTKTEQEIKALICHKWYPDSVQMGDEKISAKFAGIEQDFIHFHMNGTFSDSSKYPAGHMPKNKWSYNHKTSTITTEGGTMKIEVINEKRLVLSGNDGGQKFRMVYKKI